MQTLPRASEGSDVLTHDRAEENSPETHINESLGGLSTVWRPLSLHLLCSQVKKSSNGAYNGPQQRSKREKETWEHLRSRSVTWINRLLYSIKILQFSTLQLSQHTAKNTNFPVPSGSYYCINSIFSVLLSVFQLTTPLGLSPPTSHYRAADNSNSSFLHRNPLPPRASAAQEPSWACYSQPVHIYVLSKQHP